jgi:hypothetical protein
VDRTCGGGWWIFPVIGFIFMVIMMLACSGYFHKRGGFGVMGRYDNTEDLKREIRELKEHITQLTRSGG